jgi:hypothetical protein
MSLQEAEVGQKGGKEGSLYAPDGGVQREQQKARKDKGLVDSRQKKKSPEQ